MKTLDQPAVTSELIRRLRKVSLDSQRRWGKMTPHEMVCHLRDSFQVVMAGSPLPARGTPLQQFFMRWLAIHLPLPWPKGFKTLPEVDQEIGGTKPVEFQRDVQELLLLMEHFTQEPREFEWLSHPIFGSMTEREWMRWGYLHVDHHLRQFGT